MSKEYWLSQAWGKLKIDHNQDLPDSWSSGSNIHLIFNCGCKKSRVITFRSVASGHTKSCGKCNYRHKDYWLQQHWGELRLDPNQILPEEWSSHTNLRFRFICECKSKSFRYFYSVTEGTTSCGCLQIGQNEFSPETVIRKYVTSFVPDTYPTSYSIEGTRKSYDVYIPSKKLAIEYHGLIWHSERYCLGTKGYKKFLLAQSRGNRLIQIYQDEWRDKQEIIKAQLREILAPEKKKRIKPTFEGIQGKTPPEARTFLDQHHYLGAAGGCVTVVAKYGEAIVGVWVFMKRETGVILWHRACWHPAYKAWNPHEKALKLALPILKEMGFKKMVTFSDNRFHTGGLYEKLGFKFEIEIPPDYSYTDGNKRVSKYAMRVKAGINEVEAAKAKGWYRIWDSGKRRYGLEI